MAYAIWPSATTGPIVPGITTTDDLEWHYWQVAADRAAGVVQALLQPHPQSRAVERHGPGDRTIRPGDMIHSDVGIRYLDFAVTTSSSYILRPGETDAPEGLQALLAEVGRPGRSMSQFQQGLTGNELLPGSSDSERRVSRSAGIPHSLGHLLHEPGPLIGLPWQQENNPGRGDVALEHGYAFTMELSVTGKVPEWGEQDVCLPVEEDVVFTAEGCRPLHGRQEAFYLI